MPDNNLLTRFLEEIGAAPDESELAAITAEIEEIDFNERALEQLTNAIREARERLSRK